jgi:hypothetical protein
MDHTRRLNPSAFERSSDRFDRLFFVGREPLSCEPANNPATTDHDPSEYGGAAGIGANVIFDVVVAARPVDHIGNTPPLPLVRWRFDVGEESAH